MIVLDCSAIVEIVRFTERGKIFEEAAGLEEKLLSSTMLYAELSSTFRKFVRAKWLTPKAASMAVFTAIELVDEFHDVAENCLEAFAEGLRLNHSPYDMFYFTLARRYGATLFTCDKALARLCEQEGVAVVCPEQ